MALEDAHLLHFIANFLKPGFKFTSCIATDTKDFWEWVSSAAFWL